MKFLKGTKIERPKQESWCSGAVLAGGRGTRMGGVEKGLLTLEGERFLQRIVRQLRAALPDSELLISCKGDLEQALWQQRLGKEANGLPPMRMVVDRWSAAGPLGGLASLLSSCRGEAVLIVPCDLPLYQSHMAVYLLQQMEQQWAWADACVYRTRERVQPLCAVYRTRCLPVLEAMLQQGQYRMQSLLKELSVCWLEAEEYGICEQAFWNINTWEDYQELQDKIRE